MATATLDHLLWAVPDLESGIEDMARRTGVRPTLGGRHPGVGTHNALLSLGEGIYLEIIARDPSQTVLSGLGELLADLREPQLLTWAARTDDIEAIAARGRGAGMVGEAVEMSRQRPDGGRLSWRILQLAGHDAGTLVPFFIEWGEGSVHPSLETPTGCRLEVFWLEHPEPSLPTPLLAAFGLEVEIRHGPRPRISAVLASPAGRIEL